MCLPLRLWVLLHFLWLARRVFPFHRVLKTILLLSPVPPPEPGRHYPSPEVLLRELDSAAARAIRPMRCLERSLALVWCLRRSGLDAQLEIGFRRLGDSLVGHSWVVLDGCPWGEKDGVEADYVPMQLAEGMPAGKV